MRSHKAVMEHQYLANGNIVFSIACLQHTVASMTAKRKTKPPKFQNFIPFKLPKDVQRKMDGRQRTRLTKDNLFDVMGSILQ